MRLGPFVVTCLLIPTGCASPAASPPPATRVEEEPTEFENNDFSPVVFEEVRRIHGGVGPFAVAGYRMGWRATQELKSSRFTVTHRTPLLVQWSCVADGVQAATGVSPGKLDLRIEEVSTPEETETVFRHGTAELRFRLTEGFRQRYLDTPQERLVRAAHQVWLAPEAEVYTWELSEVQPTSRPTSRPVGDGSR